MGRKRLFEPGEPSGWHERDPVMDEVYNRNWVAPGGLFMGWYGFVQLGKQLKRVGWIAGRLLTGKGVPARRFADGDDDHEPWWKTLLMALGLAALLLGVFLAQHWLRGLF